jgi:hypothetical protein
VAATYVLVLAPTRELAVQIQSMMTKLGQFTDVTAALIVGGLSLQVGALGPGASSEDHGALSEDPGAWMGGLGHA